MLMGLGNICRGDDGKEFPGARRNFLAFKGLPTLDVAY